jgi:ABC-type nitrate/sulfonate/bicarbonate transport system substrate-binding protein
MGNGNMLLDFLKQLMRGQFLTIAVQKDMEIWISQTFEYYSDGKRAAISPKYASKYISGNERAAEGNRIIDIVKENGKFKIVQLELNSREQN